MNKTPEEIKSLTNKFFEECVDVNINSPDSYPRVNMAPHDLLEWILSNCLQKEEQLEESIKCSYCEGEGYTPEHNNHNPEEQCDVCPIAVPCGYCYASGRVTSKLMKEHINSSKVYIENDDLPF